MNLLQENVRLKKSYEYLSKQHETAQELIAELKTKIEDTNKIFSRGLMGEDEAYDKVWKLKIWDYEEILKILGIEK